MIEADPCLMVLFSADIAFTFGGITPWSANTVKSLPLTKLLVVCVNF